MSDISTHPVITHLTAKERFGSQTRLAAAAGVKPHTICGKRDSENPLTYKQMRNILRTAPEMGVEVRPDDFFPGESDDEAAA